MLILWENCRPGNTWKNLGLSAFHAFESADACTSSRPHRLIEFYELVYSENANEIEKPV